MKEQAGVLVRDMYTLEEFISLINSRSHSLTIEPEMMKEAYESLLFYDLKKIQLDEETVTYIPKKIAIKSEAMLLENGLKGMVVGMVNPLNTKMINLLEGTLGGGFTPVLIGEKDFHQLMGKYYSNIPEVLKIAQRFKADSSQAGPSFLGSAMVQSDVATLFGLIMQEALQLQCSDIHIETFEGKLTIRFRVDGALREYKVPNTQISDHLLRYIKIRANADIVEERRPIDGQHVTIDVGNKKFNIRLSILPSAFGYSIVMRLLGEATNLSLKKAIPDAAYADEIASYLKLKQGVFIVSGPTGSGKTTTLLSALSEVNTPDKKIITVEDPVESKVAGITQIQINQKIGFDFAAALRSILRQDPDVIMVGEIRDEETANATIRAAVTGHMVLATIHTRSVADIPTRLLDLGVDAFSLSMALRLLVSQRLVRLLCDNCKEPHVLDKTEVDLAKKLFPYVKEEELKGIYKPVGCEFCHGTGYVGRTVIYELLKTTQEMVIALSEKDFSTYYKMVEGELSGKKLIDRAMKTALEGKTAFKEVLSFNE